MTQLSLLCWSKENEMVQLFSLPVSATLSVIFSLCKRCKMQDSTANEKLLIHHQVQFSLPYICNDLLTDCIIASCYSIVIVLILCSILMTDTQTTEHVHYITTIHIASFPGAQKSSISV